MAAKTGIGFLTTDGGVSVSKRNGSWYGNKGCHGQQHGSAQATTHLESIPATGIHCGCSERLLGQRLTAARPGGCVTRGFH
jgi:hypothetical protein